MARFMLDTDTCSYVMKRSYPSMLDRLQSTRAGEVCISVITRIELEYGVRISPKTARDAAALAAFLPYVEVLELTESAASHYAEIRAELKRQGTPIGAHDLLIAAHARSLGLTLVTNNVAEFGRVKDLMLENWVIPAPEA